MSWPLYQQMLAVVMVVTGSINTLSTKWADLMWAPGSDGQIRMFDHPFLQATAMFLGEMLCLLVFKLLFWRSQRTGLNIFTRGNQSFNPFILMPAAMFDMIATSVMYVGLTLTYPSSFQMFRGSVIIFVAALSVTFLDKRIVKREWIGIGIVILALLVVGASDFIYINDITSKGRNSVITGDLLIVTAQIITACQMVYEEKFVSGLDIPPLQAVGWEGAFGFSVLSILLCVFYYIPAPPHFGNNAHHSVEDAIDGLVQIGNNSLLLLSILGMIVSIAFFNFAGISVTKERSATTRMVLDSVRTLVIWVVSLSARTEEFHWVQLFGFALLVLGTCVYNDLLPRRRRGRSALSSPSTSPSSSPPGSRASSPPPAPAHDPVAIIVNTQADRTAIYS